MLSDDQALHPPSGPPSRPPPIPPTQPPKGVAKAALSQGVGQLQQRHSPHHRSGEDVGGRRQLLREHVVHVTEAAAGLPGLTSSEEECKKVPIAKLQNCQFPYSVFKPRPLPPSPSCDSLSIHHFSTLATFYAHMCSSCVKRAMRCLLPNCKGIVCPPPRSVLPLASSFLLGSAIISACIESCMHICTAVVVCAQLLCV